MISPENIAAKSNNVYKRQLTAFFKLKNRTGYGNRIDMKTGIELLPENIKCGNLLYYKTVMGEILPTTIDWQDLKWATEDHKDFNLSHSPIEICEDVLFKIGFFLLHDSENRKVYEHQNIVVVNIQWDKSTGFYPKYLTRDFKSIKYLHELQNLCSLVNERHVFKFGQ